MATSQVLVGARPNISRANNAVQYILPALGGFSGALLVSAGEGVVAGKARGGRLAYRGGNFTVAAAVAKIVNTTATSFDDTVFGASYDFGVVRVALNRRMYKWNSSKQVVDPLLLTEPLGSGLLRFAYMTND